VSTPANSGQRRTVKPALRRQRQRNPATRLDARGDERGAGALKMFQRQFSICIEQIANDYLARSDQPCVFRTVRSQRLFRVGERYLLIWVRYPRSSAITSSAEFELLRQECLVEACEQAAHGILKTPLPCDHFGRTRHRLKSLKGVLEGTTPQHSPGSSCMSPSRLPVISSDNGPPQLRENPAPMSR
jgi:hypothetical protein